MRGRAAVLLLAILLGIWPAAVGAAGCQCPAGACICRHAASNDASDIAAAMPPCHRLLGPSPATRAATPTTARDRCSLTSDCGRRGSAAGLLLAEPGVLARPLAVPTLLPSRRGPAALAAVPLLASREPLHPPPRTT